MNDSPDDTVIGFVVGNSVTVCAACIEPEEDDVPIMDESGYGTISPYPECVVCNEVMQPEVVFQ